MKGVAGLLLALVFLGLGAWYFYAAQEPTPNTEPTEISAQQRSQIEADVMAWMESHLALYSDLDPAALLGNWKSEESSSISFAERATTFPEVEALVRRVLAGWESVELELLPGAVVDVLSAELVLFQGTVRQEYTPQGGEPGLYRVHMTFLLEEVGGEWKIGRNHVSGGAW